jgi:trehalose-phosphatase
MTVIKMQKKGRVFVAKMQLIEAIGAETTGSRRSLDSPKQQRMRKFSYKPQEKPFKAPIVTAETWKVEREPKEFYVDSPLRQLSSEWDLFVAGFTKETFYPCPNSHSIPIKVSDDGLFNNFIEYCDAFLFPIFHSISFDPNDAYSLASNDNWEAFQAVSKIYASKFIQNIKPGDFVLILDYELLLLPKLVAEAVPYVFISTSFSLPFPTSEVFRCLPQREPFLEALLHSHLINFCTPSFGRHFLSACTRILGADYSSDGNFIAHNGNETRISYEDFALDTKYLDDILSLQIISSKRSQIADFFGAGKFVIFGIDSQSQHRAIYHKLQAIDCLLKENPTLKSKVILVQICFNQSPHTFHYDPRVAEFAAKINSSHGSLESPIVHYYEQNIDFDEYFALISHADCYLNCSEGEGFNSSIAEFVYCQSEKKAPLIISQNSVAAKSFSGAFIINPWDHQAIARTLARVILDFSQEERNNCHSLNAKQVARRSNSNFYFSLLTNLESIQKEYRDQSKFLKFESILGEFQQSSYRVIILDYDGTLVPIKPSPMAAKPSKQVLDVLERLARDQKNTIFVVSGRDKETLETWLGHIPGLGLSAEHGSFIRFPNSLQWQETISNLGESLEWKEPTQKILQYFTERTPGSWVEQKQRSLVWHYRQSDPEFGSWQAKECQLHLQSTILAKYPVEVLLGKKIIEIRSSFCNKGICLANILGRFTEAVECVVCAGDDRTDEDMFKMLQNCQQRADGAMRVFCCLVGGSGTVRSEARYRCESPEALGKILLKMTSQSE